MPHHDENPNQAAADNPTRLRLRPRPLGAAGLDAAPAEVYKDDPRSKVWRVEHTALGPVVVKQFVYRPIRQRLSLAVGVHPAQLELARNHQLAQAGVPVVPIIDCGEERAGLGGRAWLATPVMGASLQRLLTDDACGEARTAELIDSAAALTRRLLDAGYTFKDLKPSNVVVDDAGVMRLIDVGSARPDTSKKQALRMLAVMDRVLKRDGVGRAMRERYRDAVG
ncbi:MAG: lipopolysaccharide kinase InaA family protein [Planctomycetota bacterium]